MRPVLSRLNTIAIDGDVIKELGEPLIFRYGQVWIFYYIGKVMQGFITYEDNKIIYAYVKPKFRRRGILTILYSKIPSQTWQVVASNSALPFFQKHGFKIIKSYTNCHKLTNEF